MTGIASETQRSRINTAFDVSGRRDSGTLTCSIVTVIRDQVAKTFLLVVLQTEHGAQALQTTNGGCQVQMRVSRTTRTGSKKRRGVGGRGRADEWMEERRRDADDEPERRAAKQGTVTDLGAFCVLLFGFCGENVKFTAGWGLVSVTDGSHLVRRGTPKPGTPRLEQNAKRSPPGPFSSPSIIATEGGANRQRPRLLLGRSVFHPHINAA